MKVRVFSSRLLRSRLVFAFFSFGFWSFCEFTWRGIQLKRPLLLLLGQAISRACIVHKRTSQTKACRRWWSSPALLLGGGGASPRAGGLIFHRLVEQHRCLYLLGLAMRHTFFRHLEWWLSFFEKYCSFFVWIEVLDRWCLACDEISWKNTIFRDWMACQSLAVIPQILRPFWWLIQDWFWVLLMTLALPALKFAFEVIWEWRVCSTPFDFIFAWAWGVRKLLFPSTLFVMNVFPSHK